MMSGYYFIKSHLNGLVLAIDSHNVNPGTPVFTYGKFDTYNSQQWRDDPCTGTIRNKLGDLCMDIQCGQLVLNPYQPGKSEQQWERRGCVIASRCTCNMVLDITDGNKSAGATVSKCPANGGPNQSWTFEHSVCQC